MASSVSCPQGHSLCLIEAWFAHGICYRCQQEIFEGDDVAHCGSCDWQHCKECYQREVIRQITQSELCSLTAAVARTSVQVEPWQHCYSTEALADWLQKQGFQPQYASHGDDVSLQVSGRRSEKAHSIGEFADGRNRSEPEARITNVCALAIDGGIIDSGERTTVMMRNLPNILTRDLFVQLLNDQGFSGRFNLIYLPIDFKSRKNLGYAFVSLIDAEAILDLWKSFQGFTSWGLLSEKICQVTWSEPHETLSDMVERFRDSKVMNENVPDGCKPIMLKNGSRIPFPHPTKKIKPPKARHIARRASAKSAD